MRILTWNVNVLRTCLDYHPFSSMKKKNVEGLLDELGAQIYCFQEHKTRRAQLEKSMACPGPYDAFWTFPRSKTGYSGVCTFVDSNYAVPLKAEEGITGLLLGEDRGSTMKPCWTVEERIGGYPDCDEIDWMEEESGGFDPRRLDMEGRAVVTDFGLFILFNLYCPNETNDSRRPYKMNFLKSLQERVRILQSQGREVIIAGDINIMRAPIDSGEGGIKTSAAQHYEHPARRILDDWIAPKGPMIDFVRESWPDREDMFTCWNTKLDARSANYGSRIDLILCTPALRPWLKHGDILPKIYGSDHCPVYIDLHESIQDPSFPDDPTQKLYLKEMMNPPNRPPCTAVIYPTDPPRVVVEPPRFATKFYEEFSGRQTTLKSFFGSGSGSATKRKLVDLSPTPPFTEISNITTNGADGNHRGIEPSSQSTIVTDTTIPSQSTVPPSTPFGLARAAFSTLESEAGPSQSRQVSMQPRTNGEQKDDPAALEKHEPKRQKTNEAIDLTQDDTTAARPSPPEPVPNPRRSSDNGSAKSKSLKSRISSSNQPTLASFFAPPKPKITAKPSSKIKSASPTMPIPDPDPYERQYKDRTSTLETPACLDVTENLDPEQDALIAQAIAEADEEKEQQRLANKEKAAPIWSNLFAKKLPPLCIVHQQPCKDFIVKIPGPNKGKRFWLCSLPVGKGYDSGRSKRRREDVNPEFRCDFFLWDSANSRKEVPAGAMNGSKSQG